MQRLIVVFFLFIMGFAVTQTDAQTDAQTGAATLPLIQLSSFSVESGEDLSLSASELEPGAEYDLSLTSPSGVQRVEALQADESGNLNYTVQLDEVGRWQVGLEKLEFNVTIDVREALTQPSDPTAVPETAETPEEADSETQSEAAESSGENEDEAAALQEETNEAFEPLMEPEEGETADETSDPTEEPLADGEAEESSQATESTEPTDTPALVPNTESDEAGSETAEEAQEDGLNETPAGTPEETPTAQSEETLPTPNNSADSSRRGPLAALALALGRSGWYGVLALLFAIVALHMVLIAKYWLAQTVNLERRRILGRSVAVWSRALAMRYYDLTEKLVLLLLFVAVAIMAALAAWSTPGVHPEPWNEAVVRVFQNPWSGLLNLRPNGISNLFWTFVVVLFLLAVLITVIWLFIPRLRWVGNAPRNPIYHLLAVLVPGSGLADEMWGLLLIIPWALFGLDALIDVMGWGFGLGLSLFWDVIIVVVIYLINLVAVIVEYLSYRRRMDVLKRDNPELAQEFGLLRPVE